MTKSEEVRRTDWLMKTDVGTMTVVQRKPVLERKLAVRMMQVVQKR